MLLVAKKLFCTLWNLAPTQTHTELAMQCFHCVDFVFAVCQAYAFIVGVGGMASIATMAVIALDRYRAILIHNPKAQTSFTSRRRRKALWIIFIWLYAASWVLPPFFGFGAYVVGPAGISCSFQCIPGEPGDDPHTVPYVLTLFTGGFVLPLVLIVCCYSVLYGKVLSHEVQFRNSSLRLGSRAQGRKRADIKIAKISVIVVALFCLSWLPFSFYSLLCTFGLCNFFTPLGAVTVTMVGKFSFMISPMLYAFSHPVLRKTSACCDTPRSRKDSAESNLSRLATLQRTSFEKWKRRCENSLVLRSEGSVEISLFLLAVEKSVRAQNLHTENPTPKRHASFWVCLPNALQKIISAGIECDWLDVVVYFGWGLKKSVQKTLCTAKTKRMFLSVKITLKSLEFVFFWGGG